MYPKYVLLKEVQDKCQYVTTFAVARDIVYSFWDVADATTSDDSDVIGLDGLDLALYPIHPTRSRAPIQQIQWKSNTEIGNNLEMHCIERVTHYHGHL